MIAFDPPVSVLDLNKVKAGSLVRCGAQGEQLGFAVRSTNDPNGAISLVCYNANARKFTWQYQDPQTALSYDGPLVIQPDLASFSPSFTVGVDGSLYWLDDAPTVSVQLGNSLRFLDLGTGELRSRQSWPMVGGFRAWKVGVRDAAGAYTPLIEVGRS